MKAADGKMIQQTDKKFQVELCPVAHWSKDGEKLEERVLFDLEGMTKQIRIM